MPRYMVERNFPEGLRIPLNAEGAEICRMIVMINEERPRDFLIQQNWVNARKGYCALAAPQPRVLAVNKLSRKII